MKSKSINWLATFLFRHKTSPPTRFTPMSTIFVDHNHFIDNKM